MKLVLSPNQKSNLEGLLRLTYSRFTNIPGSTEKERLAFEYIAIAEFLDRQEIKLSSFYGSHYESVLNYLLKRP